MHTLEINTLNVQLTQHKISCQESSIYSQALTILLHVGPSAHSCAFKIPESEPLLNFVYFWLEGFPVLFRSTITSCKEALQAARTIAAFSSKCKIVRLLLQLVYAFRD